MAIEEVVNWDIAARENLAVHPVGPQGDKASRISLSFQELQAAIARWRDTLGLVTNESKLAVLAGKNPARAPTGSEVFNHELWDRTVNRTW